MPNTRKGKQVNNFGVQNIPNPWDTLKKFGTQAGDDLRPRVPRSKQDTPAAKDRTKPVLRGPWHPDILHMLDQQPYVPLGAPQPQKKEGIPPKFNPTAPRQRRGLASKTNKSKGNTNKSKKTKGKG